MDNKHALRDCAEKEIEGVKYKIRLLNTSAAYSSFESITKLILPASGAAIDGTLDKNYFEADQTLTTAAMLLVKQMGEIDTLTIIKDLLFEAEADGEQINFEAYFRGRFDLLIQVVSFAIKENYGSLFTITGLKEKFKSYIEDLIPQTQEQQQSEE